MMMWFAQGLNNPWMLVSMLIVKVSHAGSEKKKKKNPHVSMLNCLVVCGCFVSQYFLGSSCLSSELSVSQGIISRGQRCKHS